MYVHKHYTFLIKVNYVTSFPSIYLNMFVVLCVLPWALFFMYLRDSCVGWGNICWAGSSWLYFPWRFQFIITSSTNIGVSNILIELLYELVYMKSVVRLVNVFLLGLTFVLTINSPENTQDFHAYGALHNRTNLSCLILL